MEDIKNSRSRWTHLQVFQDMFSCIFDKDSLESVKNLVKKKKGLQMLSNICILRKEHQQCNFKFPADSLGFIEDLH